MSYNSKYTGEQVEGFLDQIANGEISEGSSVYKWNWNSEMNGTFTEEEFENLSNADVVYITTGVAGMEMLYSVDGRVVVEDALHLGIHILSFETDTDNSEAAYVESITFIFDNASKTWSAQGGNSELITNEQLTSALEDKQDKITDLDAIRSGAEKGATALQSVPSEYVTESELTNKGYATTSALNDKVDKVSGKQLSTEDFTTALKTKLEGLSNYDDTELSEALSTLRGDFDKLVSGDTSTAIESFNEIMAFLDGIKDTQDLAGIIAAIEQQIAGKMDKVTLATVATSGSYNDLSNKPTIPAEQVNADWNATSGKAQILNKPTIPSAVTESTVSGWGFTKNTGTYSKPSGGIPKTDLASAVQTSLGKADTALQSYTEQYKGTVTGVKINGTTKNPSSGVVDLGTVITSHQDISGKADKSSLAAVATSGSYNDLTDQPDFIKGVAINGTTIANTSGTVYLPNASTGGYGVTRLNSSISSTSTTESATPSAVKAAYDLANSKQDKLESGTNIKTINGQSLVGSGDISISGGGGSSMQNKICMLEINKYIISVGDTGVFQISLDELYDMLSNNYAFFIRFKQDYNVQIVPCCINRDGHITMSEIPGHFTTLSYATNYNNNTVTWDCIEKINLDEGKQDALVTGVNIKTINGLSILGSGNITIDSGEGGGGGVYITPFTFFQFCSGHVELTDEQRNGLLNAASQNRIIGMPYDSNNQTGYIVADYNYSLSEFDYDFWNLTLGVIYNGAHYSNSISSTGNPNFRYTRMTITPFKPLMYSVTAEDGVAYVHDDHGYTDNYIFLVEGECTELYVYLEPSEIGKTGRFFTGESCMLEFNFPVYWANGEVPTIEPYTHYELSLVSNQEFAFNAVLTSFKAVE